MASLTCCSHPASKHKAVLNQNQLLLGWQLKNKPHNRKNGVLLEPWFFPPRLNFSLVFSPVVLPPLSGFRNVLSINYGSKYNYRSDEIRSVTQSCLTLCNPMNHSMPGLPVHHQLREFTQTHVHRDRDAIQPSHPLSSPSPPAPNPSQHQSLFQWVNSSHEVAKVLEFQL